MTLLLANYDPTDGTQFETATVFFHLAKLVGGDSEFGMHVDPLDPSGSVIEYKVPSKSGFCQNMIKDLVNTKFPNRVIIYGVNSSYYIQIKDIQRYHQISEFGGIVMFSHYVTWDPIEVPPYKTFDLHVFYDVQECNGMGYVAYDTSNEIIGLPIEILLLHELSHAYHYCRRDFNFSKPEVQAEIDENSARQQLGYKLRNVNNHDGRCRKSNESGTGSTWSLDNLCFIVSAAFGSAQAVEVRALQQFRDTVLRSTRLSWMFFEFFFEDYYRFSPKVSAAMRADPRLAQVIRAIFVEPLLEFWNWSRQHLIDRLDTEALGNSARDKIRQHTGKFSRGEAADLRNAIPELLVELRRLWTAGCLGNTQIEWPVSLSHSRRYSEPLEKIAALVASSINRHEILSWAILHPIEAYWRAALRYDLERVDPPWDRALVLEIESWIAALPLPAECLTQELDQLKVDLRIWAEKILTIPGVRFRMARAILERPDCQHIKGLEEAFSETGFLPQPMNQEV